MKTFFSEKHALHHGNHELFSGELVPCYEMPRRAELVLARVQEMKLGEVIAPTDFGIAPIERIHSKRYSNFLQNAWNEWSALSRSNDALPMTWPVRGMNQTREPEHIDAKLGFYSFDGGAPIQARTWEAVYASSQVALSGAKTIANGESAAFALCRPPGHHAAADYMGGYCYLNNAAIAAQHLRDNNAKRVAILDVDYHHGNGTQTIFYERNDVLLLNLHGHPCMEYPFFLGYEDEIGAGAGIGFNHNYPMPHGTTFATWNNALQDACKKIAAYKPDALVVSLGVDTFKDDPISQFLLDSPDFIDIGKTIKKLAAPTLFIMEGGYAVEPIGINAVNVLMGFEGG